MLAISHILTSLYAASLLISIAQAHAIPYKRDDPPTLGKTPLLDTYAILDADPERIPQSAQGTAKRWPMGQYPKACFDEANSARENTTTTRCEIANLEVYNVTYADCSGREPWRFCRCSDADWSIDELMDGFGTVPPGMRSNVRNLMWVNGKGWSGGGTAAANIFGFGTPYKVFFTHEATHASDPDASLSESKRFKEAIAKDTCVPNTYANKNEIEDFAEIGVWLNWNAHRTIDYAGNATCMRNQLGTANRLLGTLLEKNGKCFSNPDPDPLVISDQGGVGRRHSAPAQISKEVLPVVRTECQF